MDLALARMFPQYSRNRLQAWLKTGHALVDGVRADGSTKAIGGEKIELAPPPAADVARPKAQRMALDIVFEDADLMVIDKPVGLIVHPGAGNPDGTLLNGLLAHAPALRQVPRAGIVHRLDKDTSGLLVVAKNLTAQANLAAQLAARSVKRTYLALVHGEPPARGTIDEPIGRDPRVRTRMAVNIGGREARTHYKVIERFGKVALRRVQPRHRPHAPDPRAPPAHQKPAGRGRGVRARRAQESGLPAAGPARRGAGTRAPAQRQAAALERALAG